jgi:acyl-[acyl-carrier-protein]-phospholipid O-acyltransferase/long-chain-fatty-acid--[acyl-carrier-protein] ligase
MVLVIGLITFVVTVYVLYLLSDFAIRFTLWLLTCSIYRIRVVGARTYPPRPGAAGLQSRLFADGLLVAACMQRFIRFIMYRAYYEDARPPLDPQTDARDPHRREPQADQGRPPERRARELRPATSSASSPRDSLSRTGNALPFRRGVEDPRRHRRARDPRPSRPRLGQHLQLQGRPLLLQDAGRVPLPVTVSFGQAMPATTTAWQMRQTILELGSEAFRHRRTP